MILKDLDLLLHKIWIFYRYDISKRIVTQKQLFIQKLKVFCISLFLIITSIRCLIFAFIIDNESLPLYYFEIIHYISDYSEILFMSLFFFHINFLRVIYIKNNGHNYEWFAIIRALSGFQLFSDIGLLIRKYIQRIRFIKLMCDIYNIILTLLVILIVISILIIYLNLNEILLYGIISGIILFSYGFIGAPLTTYPFLYYYILCYYFKVCFQEFEIKLNSVIKRKIFIKQNNLIEFLNIHNDICLKIYKYNQFWCNYYFIVCYTVVYER